MRILDTGLATLAMLSFVSLSIASANNNVDQNGLSHWVRVLEEHYHRDLVDAAPPYSPSERAYAKMMSSMVKKQLKKTPYRHHIHKGVWRNIAQIRLICLLNILQRIQDNQILKLEDYEYRLIYSGDGEPQVVGDDPGPGVPVRLPWLIRMILR